MARKYTSKRREQSAEITRQSIVEAAVKMHGEGIVTLTAIAEEAGVSLPTVNKYFPTREDLFDACTTHLATNLDYPSLEEISAIEDAGEQLRRVISEVYSLHEQTFGQSWTGYKLEDESPVMAQSMLNYEGFVITLVDLLQYDNAVADKETITRFIRAALSPLTYRALRLKNGLELETAVTHMTVALAGVLNIEV